jgi:spore maturation protein CgeB
MKRLLRELLSDHRTARAMAEHGRRTVMARHTCVHRVNELLGIVAELNSEGSPADRRQVAQHR